MVAWPVLSLAGVAIFVVVADSCGEGAEMRSLSARCASGDDEACALFAESAKGLTDRQVGSSAARPVIIHALTSQPLPRAVLVEVTRSASSEQVRLACLDGLVAGRHEDSLLELAADDKLPRAVRLAALERITDEQRLGQFVRGAHGADSLMLIRVALGRLKGSPILAELARDSGIDVETRIVAAWLAGEEDLAKALRREASSRHWIAGLRGSRTIAVDVACRGNGCEGIKSERWDLVQLCRQLARAGGMNIVGPPRRADVVLEIVISASLLGGHYCPVSSTANTSAPVRCDDPVWVSDAGGEAAWRVRLRKGGRPILEEGERTEAVLPLKLRADRYDVWSELERSGLVEAIKRLSIEAFGAASMDSTRCDFPLLQTDEELRGMLEAKGLKPRDCRFR